MLQVDLTKVAHLILRSNERLHQFRRHWDQSRDNLKALIMVIRFEYRCVMVSIFSKKKTIKNSDRNILAKELGWKTAVFMLMLLVALTVNILALIFPFLQFDAAFQGSELYSIPHTIKLMWSLDLYFIAILIVAFSLTFPFVKLTMLFTILWMPFTRPGRHKALTTLRQLGRWSLLDVFVALLILILANDQMFIGATPRIGVALFLVAICLSMLTCELMEFYNRSGLEQIADPLPNRRVSVYWASGWTFWLMIPLLALSVVSLLVAVELPFFQISEVLLKHKSYSVIKSVEVLTESGQSAFAWTMMAFLVIIPLAHLVLMGILGFLPMHRRWRKFVDLWSSTLGAWSMLDVFALALLLFMTEGSALIGFDIRPGLYAILGSLVVYYVTLMIGSYAIRRVIRGGKKFQATAQ